MRMDQYRGLNEWAKERLGGCGKQHWDGETQMVEVVPPPEDCMGRKHFCGERTKVAVNILVPCVKRERSGETYEGMFEEIYYLLKYTLRDGTVYFEKVQAAPWSSGPVFFIALQDAQGNWVTNSLWSQEEIDKA